MKPQIHSPFRELKSSDEFEYLCRDLLGKSADVEGAMKLFKQGSKQYGADIVGFETGGTGLIVGQCKLYLDTTFTADKIDKSVTAFLNHWETIWETNEVVRFNLYVSQDIKDIDQLAAIQEARRQFHNLGVTFQLLDEQILKKELEPHRDIVRTWLGREYWESKICGTETRESDGFVPSAIARTFLTRNLEQQTLLSDALREPMANVRQKARSGDVNGAIEELARIKEKYFNHIDVKARAEILSLEIRISFPLRMDINIARKLLEQIKVEDSSFDVTYIDALLLGEEQGYEVGLSKLFTPTDIATLNLKLAFLLNVGRGADVCVSYESENKITPNAETKRLYAMGLLLVGRLDDAEVLINEAYDEEPTWEGVRLARGLVLYHSSLSPQILSENPLVFPSPQPWQLVKSDDESAKKRREAATLFRDILMAEPPREDSRRLIQTWYLACLADDYEQLDEAAKYAGEVLSLDPAHVYVLIWALARNLKVDFSIPLQAFEKKFASIGTSSPVDVNECILPMALYLRDGKTIRARTHFLRIKPTLSRLGESSILAYWNCQVAIAEGGAVQVDKSLSLQIKDINLRQRVQVTALLAAYNQSHTRQTRRSLTKRLLKFYRKTRDAFYLSLYCQICYGEKKWDDIAHYADALITRTQTGESLYLVCSAFQQAKRLGRCLEYLERYNHFFPKGELPTQLRRLKAYGLLYTGKIKEASVEARRLWESEKSTDNFITLIETHRHLGDTYYIQKAVSDQNLAELSPSQKLRLAQILASDNPELAAEVWRQALPALREANTLLDAAFYQGKQLGLDLEVDELVPQLFASARAGNENSRLLTLEETLMMMSERSKHLNELDLAYRQGTIPIHLYCEERGHALSHLLHQMPLLNSASEHTARKYPVLIRSAAKTDSRDAALRKAPDGNYYFDVSSLLVAHHLSLLPLIERLATPIFVSNEVIPCLDAEIHQVRNISPSRERAARIVTKLADAKTLNSIESLRSLTPTERVKYGALLLDGIGERDLSLIVEAIDKSAVLITHVPLHNHVSNKRDVSLSPELAAAVTDWSTVVAKLLDEKCLSGKTADHCRKVVKNEALPLEKEKVPFGSSLLLSGLVVAQYAELDILGEICGRYHVLLDGQDLKMLRSDLLSAEQQEELVLWIQGLKSHIAKGFEQGLYEGISLDKLVTDVNVPDKIKEDYRTKPFFQLLALQNESEGAAFVDDRWVTTFSTINHKLPVLTIYETLDLLKQAGLLSDEERSLKLNQLRDENFCYLPLESHELLANAERSPSDSAIIETEASHLRRRNIATMRRYYSLHLSDERWLKPPPANQANSNYLGEIDFVFSYQRAVLDALIQIWLDADSGKAASGVADSLVFDFYLGRFGARHFYPKNADSNDGAMHSASDFVDLCLQGLSLLTSKKFKGNQRIERLKQYLQWVENIFHVNLISGTQFVDYVVKHLETYLLLSRNAQTRIGIENEVEHEKIFITLQLQLFDFLPDVVREKLYASSVLRDSFDFKTETVVTAGGYNFEASELWKSIGLALAGEKPTIKPRLIEQTLVIERNNLIDTNQKASVKFTDESGKSYDISGAVVGLQLPTASLRRAYLKTLRNTFDCDETTFLKDAEIIAGIEDPSERSERFNGWIKNSMTLAYETLNEQMRNRKGFIYGEIEALPLRRLPDYFRIDRKPDIGFGESIICGAETILNELGLKEALNRFSLLPRKIPRRLVEELSSLGVSERRYILNELRKQWRSPVGRIHYVYLALTVSSEDAEILQAVEKEIRRINTEEVAALEFAIFETLLDLVEVLLARTGVADKWTTPENLAFMWGHATQLTNIILQLADDEPDELPKLLKFLRSLLPMWCGRLFDSDESYINDVLNPKACSRETFFGFAFGTLLQDVTDSVLRRVGIFDTLNALCLRDLNGELIPKYPFWTDIAHQSNLTESWLSIEAYEAFFRLLGGQDEVKLFWPSGLTEHVVLTAEILAKEQSAVQWRNLLFTASGAKLNQKASELLPAIVRNLDFSSVWAEDRMLSMMILGFLASQWKYLDDLSRQKVKAHLTWVAKEMEETYPHNSPNRFTDDEIQRDTAFQIAQIAASTSEDSDAAKASEKWNALIMELGGIWPALHAFLEPLLFRLWLEQPLNQIQGIGKNILQSRFNRQR